MVTATSKLLQMVKYPNKSIIRVSAPDIPGACGPNKCGSTSPSGTKSKVLTMNEPPNPNHALIAFRPNSTFTFFTRLTMVNVKVLSMRIRVIISACLLLTLITPANAAPKYVFPIPSTPGCKPTYSRYHHDYPATDILAKKGCRYVAVTSGVIDEIRKKDTYTYKNPTPITKGGIFISMIGDDGVRYYASHLNKIVEGIEIGTRVEVGTLLGYVGNSGDAAGTAPHIHFGISWPTEERDIWWVRRGVVFPWRYLDKWKVGGDRSPASEVKALLEKSGAIPPIPKK